MNKKILSIIGVVVGFIAIIAGAIVIISNQEHDESIEMTAEQNEESESNTDDSSLDVTAEAPAMTEEEIKQAIQKEKSTYATSEKVIGGDADITTEMSVSGEDPIEEEMSKDTRTYVEHVLICDADSEKEAQKIAKRIGGTLVEYSYGIGTIEIEDTVEEALKRIDKMIINKPSVYPDFILKAD